MTNEARQESLGNSAARSATPSGTTRESGVGILMAGAGILILLGLMAQFGELGLGPFTHDSFWILSFLAQGVWNILMALLSGTALADASPFWPLMIVMAGSTAVYLLSSKSGAAQESNRRSDYGR